MTTSRADGLRHAMVDELVARRVITRDDVAEAMRAVPRHRFLADPSGSDDELDAVHRVDDAFVLKGDEAVATSSLSSPVIVASMIELLELKPGMRVLEIGAGGGYNAAVLAHVLGDGSLVTSVEIDAEVAGWARQALDATGYADVAVVTADGFLGVPERAPFDRVIATVGCTDLAPAWLDQLDPKGFALIPLEHGGLHPLMRITPTIGGRADGRLVGRSGFVRMQGMSDRKLRWPSPPRPQPAARSLPLPPELAIFRGGAGGLGTTEAWDFYYYLALTDARVAHTTMILDRDRGGAYADLANDRVLLWGEYGPYDDLLAHLGRWRGLGSPRLDQFVSELTPIDEPLPAADGPTWLIDRVAFRQLVRLSSSS